METLKIAFTIPKGKRMIDTLKLSRRLADAGMDRKQAEAIADELNEGLREAAVTKADLTAAKADIMTTIAKAKNEMLTWQIGIAFVLFGALKFLK
jgi:asparagine synthetase B (glutamine-hydrolysing)